MGNKIETIKNKWKFQRFKSIIYDIKKLLEEHNNRFEMAEERISKLKAIGIEIIQYEE